MSSMQTIHLTIHGMDCTNCAQQIERDVRALLGVAHARVLLSAEKATIQFDSTQLDRATIVRTIEHGGYQVGADDNHSAPQTSELSQLSSTLMIAFGVVFVSIIGVVTMGEQFGWFDALTAIVPLPIGVLLVLGGGYPIFRTVIRAALKGKVLSHTLMTVGVIAAVVIGDWPTAVLVVLFMRTGEFTERFTTERARHAVKQLTALAPKTARIEQDGQERIVPIDTVAVGDIVVVRPGDALPVDGVVIAGRATLNQASITGESMPIEATIGDAVFAATLAAAGSLRIRATAVGADSTFGKVITLVEEAEAHRADVQRIGDTFSAYYLPVVAGIAILTFLIRRDPLATAAVLLVACSCSFALATPIAMLASIGAAAKQGILIKGGKYLEALAQTDVVLVDKTGTLTVGQPMVTRIIPRGTQPEAAILERAAAAEYDSEHPLAMAIRQAAQDRGMTVQRPRDFVALPGQGVQAVVGTDTILVGSPRMLGMDIDDPAWQSLEAAGNTVVAVSQNNQCIGLLGLADTVRPEIASAIAALRSQGIATIEMLTGDNERVAATLAEQLAIGYRANLLPEEKIAIVRAYQEQGHRVLMIGDGVNDAPALAQAHVGIAMGVAGTDVALEAAHIALMRTDWMLVPAVVAIAKRTMGVVKSNIAFTAIYNLVGLTLAAFGILPPVFAAAAQSLPDLGIMANSARLLRLPPMAAVPSFVKSTIPLTTATCTDDGCASHTPMNDGGRAMPSASANSAIPCTMATCRDDCCASPEHGQ